MPAKFKRGVDLSGQRGINVADPSAATDAANKQYVDSAVQGLSDLKDPVRVATTGAITLSGTQSVDGVALAAGDRVLVKNQADATTNGIYAVATGAWTRTTDADNSSEVTRGLATTVLEGTTKGTGQATTNPVTYVVNTSGTITLGTTALNFAPIGSQAVQYTGGAGLVLTGTDFSVGAGTGISVAADAVAIDTNVVVRKFAAASVATTNPQTFTHNLGTDDVTVSVWEGTELVYPDVTKGSGTVIVDWGGAPTAGQYRVVIHG